MTEEKKELELRMYFFVPYNISDIQKSIQAGHAALEYSFVYGSTKEFIDFVTNWKTWIILNGGATNEKRNLDGVALGSLNQIGDDLLKQKINFSYFCEPDLNDALTAVCFICDERIWNYEDYPDFLDWVLKTHLYDEPSDRVIRLRMMGTLELTFMFPEYYKEWAELIGGPKNMFLRELIKGKKLA